eukprot:gene37490-34528_t
MCQCCLRCVLRDGESAEERRRKVCALPVCIYVLRMRVARRASAFPPTAAAVAAAAAAATARPMNARVARGGADAGAHQQRQQQQQQQQRQEEEKGEGRLAALHRARAAPPLGRLRYLRGLLGD